MPQLPMISSPVCSFAWRCQDLERIAESQTITFHRIGFVIVSRVKEKQLPSQRTKAKVHQNAVNTESKHGSHGKEVSINNRLPVRDKLMMPQTNQIDEIQMEAAAIVCQIPACKT